MKIADMFTFVPLFWFMLCCSILFDLASSQSISKSKPTIQSTTFTDDWVNLTYPSSYAVDGDNATCSETEDELNPWWQVDLRKVYTIKKVIFSGKDYVYGEVIEFSSEHFRIVHSHAVVEADHNGITFEINFDVSARFVRISKSKNTLSGIKLCEVQVYGND